ncbi:MAG: DNA polymerase III subunit alpha, partial [Smithellaceae bacterium]|nr:DNA polymerase III subunit alpha [Smithellaceae bacterium]
LLMQANTDGVFQVESSGMKDILVRMKPDCLADLIALIALYRPGPMNMVPEFIARKQGKTPISYELPELEAILKETYGVILYQEQVMQIAGAIGGYTMAEADTLRKVMGKKMTAQMEREKPKFIAGAKARRIAESKALQIWQKMETFAEYGFNKSHSTAYAMISFQTAYLKAHYPAEFMAALLTSEKDNRDKIIKYISSCKEMEIDVLPPDINESLRDFSVSGGNIRFGLAAVKNVGVGAIDSIIQRRSVEGPFTSFHDFCRRVDLRKVNKRVFESLIKCGAFDTMGFKRRQLIENFEAVIERTQRVIREQESAQSSIFAEFDAMEDAGEAVDLPDLAEWDSRDLLSFEKETLGFYITGHPLLRFKDQLGICANTDTSRIEERHDKDIVIIGGIVAGIREAVTKKKDTMAYVTLEDLQGSIMVIFFPEVYRGFHGLLHGGEPILIKGSVDIGEENTKLIATEVQPLANATSQAFNSIHFHVDARKITAEDIQSLALILGNHRGSCDGFIHLLDDGTETVISLGPERRIEISSRIKKEADFVLGDDATQFS